ncbi:BQ2448_3929 [Microbotryum intermedium]|uniref:BQ2448_3929 protein n=1 Tax=Microbotryum intermedium TaxID=269621 RepID=A0A238FEZ7_9BASI|nr:BQ2448_3929 [Microbotryum intermedium]
MVSTVSHERPSLPVVDDATARHASDAPVWPSASINFVTTTSRTDSSTSMKSNASSSRSNSLSRGSSIHGPQALPSVTTSPHDCALDSKHVQLDRDELVTAPHPASTTIVRASTRRIGSAPPDRMRKSALARVMAVEGLESHVHVDPMRSDSLHHFDRATSTPTPRSQQSADSESTDGEGSRSILTDAVKFQPLPTAPRSPHRKLRALLGRAPFYSPDPRQRHGSLSLSPSENLLSKGIDDTPRRPDMSRSTSEPGTRGRHGRAKSVSALFGKISSQQNEMPPLAHWLPRSASPSEERPAPSAPVLPATRPPSSWIRQRLRPSTSSLFLAPSRKQLESSKSPHSTRAMMLPSTPSSTSVHTVQSSAPSHSSTAQSWHSKSDFGFIKALGSFVAGRKQSKVDDTISDEELLSWRRPAVEHDRGTAELAATDRISSSSVLGSSGRGLRGSPRTNSLSKTPSRTRTEEDVLVIERSSRSDAKTSWAGRESTTKPRTTHSPVESAVPLESNLSNSHVHHATRKSHSGAQPKMMWAASKSSHLQSSSPLLIENRPLRSPRSSPCLPRSTSSGIEGASQLAASLSLYVTSSSTPPPLPLGLAPRPAAAPRKKLPSRVSEPPVGEARRIISNEAWEQVSLSARKKQSTRSLSGSSAASRPLVASSSPRTSANEDTARGAHNPPTVST